MHRIIESPALDFLLADLNPTDRDAVSRAYYEFARGDGKCFPVGLSLLLTACARQIAQAPDAIKGTLDDQKALLQAMVNAAHSLEKSLDRSSTLVQTIESHRDELKTLIEKAVERIDVEKVTRKFETAFGDAVAHQSKATKAFTDSATAAEASIRQFRRLQYGWILTLSFVTSFCLCAIAFLFGWIWLKESTAQQLEDRISQEQASVQQLVRTGKTMTIERDANGGVYLVVPDVTDAYVSQDKRGIIKLR